MYLVHDNDISVFESLWNITDRDYIWAARS